MRRILAVVALATLAACDSFDPLVENTVTGTWRGSSAGQTFVVTMQQSGTTVAGSGTITGPPSGARNLSLSGTFNQPAFSATLTPNGAQAITYNRDRRGPNDGGHAHGRRVQRRRAGARAGLVLP